MSENDLARALQALISRELPAPPDPRQIAQEIIRGDQGRVRLLAWLSVLFWLLGAAGLILLVIGLDRFVIFVRVSDFYRAHPEHVAKPEPGMPLSQADIQMLNGTQLLHKSLPLVGGSVVSLLLAALCTVLLVFSSRRATLRQINLSLLAISEQLRQMRPMAHGESAGELRKA